MDIQTILQIAIIIIACLIPVAYLIYKIKTKGLRPVAVELIVAAEKEFQSGQGSQKMEYVYNALIALVPQPFKMFITKTAMINFIQNIFDEIKVALDYKEEVK